MSARGLKERWAELVAQWDEGGLNSGDIKREMNKAFSSFRDECHELPNSYGGPVTAPYSHVVEPEHIYSMDEIKDALDKTLDEFAMEQRKYVGKVVNEKADRLLEVDAYVLELVRELEKSVANLEARLNCLCDRQDCDEEEGY